MKPWLQREERLYLTASGEAYRIAYLTDAKAAIKDETFVTGLATCYRDIFGHGAPIDPASWSEYLHCPRCHRRYAIGDVYSLDEYQPLAELNERKAEGLTCKSVGCGALLQPSYPLEKLKNRLLNAMADHPFFCSLALGNGGNIAGLHYGWVAPLEELWDDFSYLYEGTDATRKMFIHSARSRSAGAFSDETKVLYMTELGVTLPARDKRLLQGLVRAFFKSMPPEVIDLPSLAVSEPDKRGYALLDAAGHQPLFSISGRNTTVMGGKARETAALWNLPAATFKAACTPAIERSRQYGQAIPA